MDIKTRLKKYIKDRNDKISKIEKKMEVANGYINSIENGIGADKLERLLEIYPNLDLNWLMIGKKTKETIKEKKEIINVIEINPEAKANILVADIKVSAGFGNIIQDHKALEKLPAISLPNAPLGLNVAFQTGGDSMHPTVRHLDYVVGTLVQEEQQIKSGHTFIIIDKEDGALYKRMYKEGDYYRIVSDNPIYSEYKKSKHEVLGLFKVWCRFSYDFRNYHSQIRNDIEELKNRVEVLEKGNTMSIAAESKTKYK